MFFMDTLVTSFIFSPFNHCVYSDSPQIIIFIIELSLEVPTHKIHWLLDTLLRQNIGTCSGYSWMPSKSPINVLASNNNNNLLSLTVSMGRELEIGLVGQVWPRISQMDAGSWGWNHLKAHLFTWRGTWAGKIQSTGPGTPHQSWSYTIHNAIAAYGIFKHKQSGIHHLPNLWAGTVEAHTRTQWSGTRTRCWFSRYGTDLTRQDHMISVQLSHAVCPSGMLLQPHPKWFLSMPKIPACPL